MQLEDNIRKHKIFDAKKAKAQIEVYREIYKINEGEDAKLKLLQGITNDNKEKLENFFKEDIQVKLDENMTEA